MARSKPLFIAWLVAGSLFLPGAPALAIVTISVHATYGYGPVHVTPAGGWIATEASLVVDDFAYFDGTSGQKATFVIPVDVYLGMILPDGRFTSWVGDPQAPTLATGAAPVPILANVALSNLRIFHRFHQFGATDPRGWYVLYGLVVFPGANPLDPRRWINTSFFPLLLTAPITFP